jgi:FMN phosphatase YigB (HAD superfamily)
VRARHAGDVVGVGAGAAGRRHGVLLRGRLRKPDPAIYRRATDGLGAGPEQCLYCGDAPYELVGAEAVGMAAVQLRDGGNTPPLFLPDRVEHPAWSGPAIDDLRALVPLFA